MHIHKEGYKIIAVSFLLAALLGLLIQYSLPFPIFQYILYFGLFVFLAWTISFFRVPHRQVNADDNHVLASADGEVVTIEEVVEPEYFNEKRLQVSVFMSPLNVHANWYPFDGEVKYSKYHPGKFLVAYHPKSSELNERTTIVLEKESGKDILIRQIAGIMARRIINYAKAGDRVKQGDEFGIIRFGSRVDFFLPLDAKINVKLGDKVTAKQTVVAYFK